MARNKTSMAKNKEFSCKWVVSNWLCLLMEDDEKVASDDSNEKIVEDKGNDEVKDIKHSPCRWTKRNKNTARRL